MHDHASEAEQAITLPMITNGLGNARLQAILARIDTGSYAVPLTCLRQALACQAGTTTGVALARTMRGLHGRVQVADLQVLAIGFYRLVWRLLERLDSAIDLERIRALDAADAAQLCYGFTFGCRPRTFPVPRPLVLGFLGRLSAITRTGTAADGTADGGVPPAGSGLLGMLEGWTSAIVPADDLVLLDVMVELAGRARGGSSARAAHLAGGGEQVSALIQQLIAVHRHAAAHPGRSLDIPYGEAAIACLLAPFSSVSSWLRANRDLRTGTSDQCLTV